MTLVSNLHVLPVGPANHHSIIMSKGYTATKPYNNEGERFCWKVEEPVPCNATALLLRFKLKAYVPSGAGKGYCQGNIRFVNEEATMNHFIHVDEWGRGEGNSGEGRRVAYATVFAPIKDGKVEVDVAHEISGRGNIEFVAYLEGWVTEGLLSLCLKPRESEEPEQPEEPEEPETPEEPEEPAVPEEPTPA